MPHRTSKKPARKCFRRPGKGNMVSLSLARSVGESLLDLMEKIDSPAKKERRKKHKKLDSHCEGKATMRGVERPPESIGHSLVNPQSKEASKGKRKRNLGKKFVQDFRHFARLGDKAAKGDTISFDKTVKWFKKAELLDNRRVTRGDIEVHFIDKLKKDYELGVLPFIQFLKTLCLDRGLRMSGVLFKLCTCRQKAKSRSKLALLFTGKNHTPEAESKNMPSNQIKRNSAEYDPHKKNQKIPSKTSALETLLEEKTQRLEEQNPALNIGRTMGTPFKAKTASREELVRNHVPAVRIPSLDIETTSAEDKVAKWLKETSGMADANFESTDGFPNEVKAGLIDDNDCVYPVLSQDNELKVIKGFTNDDDYYLHLVNFDANELNLKDLTCDNDHLHPVTLPGNEQKFSNDAVKATFGLSRRSVRGKNNFANDDDFLHPVLIPLNERKINKDLGKVTCHRLVRANNNVADDDDYLHPVPIQSTLRKITEDTDTRSFGKGHRMVRGRNNFPIRNGAEMFDLASCMSVRGKMLSKEGHSKGVLQSSNKRGADRVEKVTDHQRASTFRSKLQRTSPSSKIQAPQRTGAANFITVEHLDVTDDSTDVDGNETRNMKKLKKGKPGKKVKAKAFLPVRNLAVDLADDSADTDGNKIRNRTIARKWKTRKEDKPKTSLPLRSVALGILGDSIDVGGNEYKDRTEAKKPNTSKEDKTEILLFLRNAVAQHAAKLSEQSADEETSSLDPNFLKYEVSSSSSIISVGEGIDFAWLVSSQKTQKTKHNSKEENIIKTERMVHFVEDNIVRAQNSVSSTAKAPENIEDLMIKSRKKGEKENKCSTINDVEEFVRRSQGIEKSPSMSNHKKAEYSVETGRRNIRNLTKTIKRNDNHRTALSVGNSKTINSPAETSLRNVEFESKAPLKNSENRTALTRGDPKTIKSPAEIRPRKGRIPTKMVGKNGEDGTVATQKTPYSCNFSNTMQQKTEQNESKGHLNGKLNFKVNKTKKFHLTENTERTFTNLPVSQVKKKLFESKKEKMKAVTSVRNSNQAFRITESATGKSQAKAAYSLNRRFGISVENSQLNFCSSKPMKFQDTATEKGCLTEKAQDDASDRGCLTKNTQNGATEKECLIERVQARTREKGCPTAKAQNRATEKGCLTEKAQDKETHNGCLTEKAQNRETHNGCLTEKAQDRETHNGILIEKDHNETTETRCLTEKAPDSAIEEGYLTEIAQDREDEKGCIFKLGLQGEDNSKDSEAANVQHLKGNARKRSEKESPVLSKFLQGTTLGGTVGQERSFRLEKETPADILVKEECTKTEHDAMYSVDDASVFKYSTCLDAGNVLQETDSASDELGKTNYEAENTKYWTKKRLMMLANKNDPITPIQNVSNDCFDE